MVIFGAMALLACGGSRTSTPPPAGPPAAARDFTATRWIPARPTYAVAARSVRDAQRATVDVIDSFGMIAGVEVGEVSRALRGMLAVDPLAPEAITAMGIDVDGGIAMFSESMNPTFVVHLSAPDQTQAFFDRERERGLATQSQIVDGAEIFTAKLDSKLGVSWVVVKDWLWIHFTLPIGVDEGTTWFTSSRTAGAPTWSADWEWAEQGGKPTLVGFVDPRGLLSKLSVRIPEAVACARLFEPVGRVGFSIEGDGRRVGGRLAIDVGSSANGIAKAVLPAPNGWGAAAGTAPLAVQWNLDLLALRTWLTPCARTFDRDLSAIDTYGVRTARVLLQSFDPDDKSGSGAVALDLTSGKYFASLLDQIPLRSTFESRRTYGPHAGRSLSVPFGPKIDYVLTDTLALAGVGDGLLARVVGGDATRTPGAPGPLLAIDVMPGGLSRETWEFLLRTAEIPQSKRIAERLMRWRDGHLAIKVDGTRLVLEASGNRK